MPGDQQFGYQPALDGVRGVAVALVLCFHSGFSWMSGGYVGVSVFFTLSGFLITSLLILEHQRTGRVSWSAFVVRRAKRLLPASLLCLVAIALLAWSGQFADVPHLRRDIVSAAMQVANWNALHGSGSYADLLSRSAGVTSPVEHYWSLAVEEQFYWVWPLAFMLLRRVSKGRMRLFMSLAALAATGVVAARVIAVHWGPDEAYWATPARVGEILSGAALAAGCVVWQRRPRWLGALGVGGLAVVLWAAVEWPTRGGPAYAGWLGVFSLASAALILGLQAPGVLRTALSVQPLVWLGRISYGVYVYHWPIFLLLTRRTVGLTGWSLFALRIAATVLVAVLSFVVVEQPVRRGGFSPRRALTLAMPITAAVVVLAVLLVPAAPGRRKVAVARSVTPTSVAQPSTATATSPATSTSTSTSHATTTTTAASTTAATAAALRVDSLNVVLIGDSTAVALNDGLTAWAGEAPGRTVASIASLGCGLIRGATLLGDVSNEFGEQCDEVFGSDLPHVLRTNGPQLALIMVTIPDLTMREWSGDEGMLLPTDDRYRARMLDDYRAAALTLVAGGVQRIAWVVPPAPSDWWVGWESEIYTPEGWRLLTEVIDTVAGEFPGVVDVVHLDSWFGELGADNDDAVRSDGLHLSAAGALWVMDEFLGPVLLRLAAV